MTSLQPYRANDRRCYNGCSCSDLQRELDHTDYLLKRMKKAYPEARCTYFPMEEKYMVFVKNKPLTNRFYESKQDALIEAIEIFEQ